MNDVIDIIECEILVQNKRAEKDVIAVQWVKGMIRVGLLGVFGVVAWGTYFVISTLEELNLSSLNRAVGPPERIEQRKSLIEKGALFRKGDLAFFHTFSQNEGVFEDTMKEMREQKTVQKIEGDLYSFDQDVEISGLLRNDCPFLYCYQHRVKFGELPGIFWKGLIGIEDYRFINHFGIDFRSIVRAILTDIKELKMVQGGSTVTQQLVKNLFLTNEKSFKRKLKEIVLALYIESQYSKEEILEAYFNEIHWGSVGGIKLKGIYAASLFMFQKKLHALEPVEVAILIGMLKGPYYYSPLHYPDRLIERTGAVYNKLVQLALFPRKGPNFWHKKDWEAWFKKLKEMVDKNQVLALWWTSVEKGKELSEFERFVFKKAAISYLDDIKEKTQRDISVKAIVGKLNGTENYQFYSKYERNLGEALSGEYHQMGSTIKPILYQIFRDLGRSLQGEVETGPLSLDLPSGQWSPREAHQIEEKSVRISEALQKSFNRPVVRIASELGMENVEAQLEKRYPRLKKPLSEYPAQLLGSLELGLTEIFELYKDFIKKECLQGTAKENIINLLSDPSHSTVRLNVGKYLKNQRFFGKTGTTNKGRDNWYIALVGKELMVLWVGQEGRRDEEELKLYGSTTAFKIFNVFQRERARRVGELYCLANE